MDAVPAVFRGWRRGYSLNRNVKDVQRKGMDALMICWYQTRTQITTTLRCTGRRRVSHTLVRVDPFGQSFFHHLDQGLRDGFLRGPDCDAVHL